MAQVWTVGGITHLLALGLLGGAIAPPAMTLALPFSSAAIAQIAPDSTLGNERSQVIPNRNIRGLPGILIQGGARRGSNLFQSFSEFNVGEGQRVYFANPNGINTILSRVTGRNPSNILGTLGVTGTANLFLLNPNGILFGTNARLDIAGSFVASTADSLEFGNGLKFSATHPEAAPMLTVTLNPGLQYGTAYRDTISNAGNLSVGNGQTLALAGNTVTQTGSLTAPGGTVQVLGNAIALLDHAHIDVSGVGGGGTVQIGGNFQGKGPLPNASDVRIGANVIINADGLSAPTSPNPVNGGQVVVWSNGFTQFEGTISARGSDGSKGSVGGDGGTVEVSGKQTLVFNGQVNTAALNGNPGRLLLDPYDLVISQPITSASELTLQADNNITINAPITITSVGAGLFATAGNTIAVNNDITTNGGTIALEAQNGSITVHNVELNTCPTDDCGTSAFITLEAKSDIQVENSLLLSRSSNSQLFDDGQLRAIALVSNEGSVSLDNVGISTTNFGSGNAGLVVITARDTVSIQDSLNEDRRSFPGIFSRGNGGSVIIGGSNLFPTFPTPQNIYISHSRINVDNDPTGKGGTAKIDSGVVSLQATNAITLENGTLISSSTFRTGDAGGVVIKAGGSVSLSNSTKIFSNVEASGNGTAGIVSVEAEALSLFNNSVITTSTFGNGNAGAIYISARGDVELTDGSVILSAVGSNATGDAGGLILKAENLLLENDSFLTTETTGQGQAGLIVADVNKLISVKDGSGIRSTVASGLAQDAGGIALNARTVHVRNDSEINVNNLGSGLAGDIVISARGIWLDNDSSIKASTRFGFGGNVLLDVPGAVILGRSSNIFASALVAPTGQQGGGAIAIGNGAYTLFSILSRGTVFTGYEFDQPTLLVASKTLRDNNVFAQGFEAAGGVIRVNAFRLQDIAQRSIDTPTTNDISSRSYFDVDGTTVVNTLNIFPSFRSDPLPERYQTPVISESCDPRVRQESSKFTITGRGGVPSNPTEVLNQDTLSGTSSSQDPELPQSSTSPSSETASSHATDLDEIVPAQGWARNTDGTIRLTAYATDRSLPLPNPFWSNPAPCSAP